MRLNTRFARMCSTSGQQNHRRAYGKIPSGRRFRALSQLLVVICALAFGNGIADVACAQAPPPMPPIAQNDWGYAVYNEFVMVDILTNDSGTAAPLASYSVTIVTEPQLGTVTVDPLSGVVLYVPDGTSDGLDWFEYTVADEGGQVSNTARVDIFLMNMPPMINSFEAISGAGNTWTFSGHITDENPVGTSVVLGGIVNVVSVPVAADGTFSATVALDPNAFGTVTANAFDDLGVQSGTANVTAGGLPPLAQDDWDFANYNEFVVVDILTNDMGTSTPLATYSVTIVTEPQLGTVTVDPLTGMVLYVPDGSSDGLDWFEYTVADEAGRVSNTARVEILLMNMPPSINDFQAIPGGGNTWTFAGQITDENPAGMSVVLGGIVNVANIPVAADGTFSATVALDPNAFGTVTANAFDELGSQSGTAYATAGQF